MRDTFLLLTFITYLGLSFSAPFVAILGYLWIDLAAPQLMGYSFLNSISMAQWMGLMALGTFLVLERNKMISVSSIQLLLFMFAGWVTLTTTWSFVPDAAWGKWDWAFKTIVFAAFAPFVINNRIRLEAFIATFVLAIAINYLPVAAKTILSGGGGYGKQFTIISNANIKLTESSALSMACVLCLPLLYALKQHTLILPRSRWVQFGIYGFIVAAIVAIFGTHARTGLICLIAFLGLLVFRSQKKILALSALSIVAVISLNFLPMEWQERMNTIRSPTEDTSASVRVAVWKWTIDFARDYPGGGGFEVYRINSIAIMKPPAPNSVKGPQEDIQRGRAFHSIYFEVLGEHGWFGLLLFVTIFLVSLLKLYKVYRQSRHDPETRWLSAYALALAQAIFIILVGGIFVGMAFQPLTLFTISMAVMIINIHGRSRVADNQGANSVVPQY